MIFYVSIAQYHKGKGYEGMQVVALSHVLDIGPCPKINLQDTVGQAE